MDIACPSCAAAYEIDDATVTASGRKVRCADCMTVWRIFPAGLDPSTGATIPNPEPPSESEQTSSQAIDETSGEAAIPAEEPKDGPAVTGSEEPARPRGAKWAKDKQPKDAKGKRKGARLGWPSVAIAASLLVVAAGIHQRATVVRYVPQMAKLYAAIHLPVNLRGIVISNVASRIVNDNDESVLIVDGDLVNITDRKVDVPRLYFSVLGKDGQQIYAWSAQADRTSLQPGERLNFRRRLAAPPADSKDVNVRFLTRSDITAGIR